MRNPKPIGLVLLAGFIAFFASATSFAQAPSQKPTFENLLQQGKTAAAEGVLNTALKENPNDDQARFALGIVQFLRAVEGRMQAFYRYGCLRTEDGDALPFTNLPIPPNPNPDPLDYKTARQVLQAWIDDLAKAEATLAQVKSPEVKLPLHLGLVRLDFNGDGEAEEKENLWRIYRRFNTRVSASSTAQTLVIAFDRGDVDWLRGYCHVLSAVAETLLAYDFKDLFDQTAYLFFKGVKAPEVFLVETLNFKEVEEGLWQFVDLGAMIHLIRLPLAEPGRLKSVLAHMEAMVALSRSSWKFILAETDNDREWVPSPTQKSVVSDAKVSSEMIKGWFQFLDEFESILKGEKLAPFWRGNESKRGINVRRVFTEPRPFDLVLWVQGIAAVPYLEQGEISSRQTWNGFNRTFRGEFIGFAIWFN